MGKSSGKYEYCKQCGGPLFPWEKDEPICGGCDQVNGMREMNIQIKETKKPSVRCGDCGKLLNNKEVINHKCDWFLKHAYRKQLSDFILSLRDVMIIFFVILSVKQEYSFFEIILGWTAINVTTEILQSLFEKFMKGEKLWRKKKT